MFFKQVELFEFKSCALKTCTLKTSCKYCGNTHGNIYRSQKGCHAGYIRCSQCDRFQKWVAKNEFDRAVKFNLVNG